MYYKVILELSAESPLDAAKKAKEYASTLSLIYTIEDEDEIIYSVDLDEDDENAVTKKDNYIPLI